MDKIPELVNRIERLEKEADLYYGEERESIENNIEKLTDELKKELTPYNEQLEQLEKNYNDRIARLEREAALYYGEAREPMDNNIEKLKIELKQEKDKILNQLEKQGVNLEKFGYREAKQEEINQEEEPTTPKEDVVMENPDIEEPQENVQAGVLGVRRAAFATMFAEMERGYEDLLQELPEEYFKRKEEILNSVNNNEMVHNLYMSYQKGEMTLPKVMNELMNKAIKENDFEKAVKAKRALEKIQARSIQNQQTVEEEQIEVGTQEAPTVNNNENETSIQVDTEESKNDKTQQRANQEDDKTEEKRLFEARKMLRAEIDRIKTESAQKYGYLGLGKYMRDTCNICLKISSTVTAEEIEKFTQRLKGKTILDVHRDNLEEIKASIEKAKANGKDESFIKKFEEFEKDTENIIQNLENIEKRDNEDKRTNPEEEQAKKEAEKERRFRRQELEFMFKNKEMRFEDLLAEPYINFKKDMFKLIDRDLDGAKKVMLEMHGMKLSDIYKIMLAKAQELGQKEKTEELLKYLEKVEQREIEIEKEAKEQTKKEEDLKKAAESRQRKEKSKQDEELKHEGEQHSKKKVMDKTTIDIDAKNNIIRIYKKGTSEPLYEVSDAEDIKTFINNGKEYKKDKEYRKEFGKKTLKKVDPAILGILVDIGNMELAEEYVNA